MMATESLPSFCDLLRPRTDDEAARARAYVRKRRFEELVAWEPARPRDERREPAVISVNLPFGVLVDETGSGIQ